MKKQRKEFKFYTQEEEAELKKAIAEGINPTEYAKQYSEAYGRRPANIVAKINKLKEGASSGKFSHNQETVLKHCIFRGDNKETIVEKYSKEWNMPKQALAVKINWLSGNITKTKEEQQGLLFEGTPSKVILFSDHFRVYF